MSAEIAAALEVETGTEFPVRYEILELVEPELLVLRSDPQPEIGLPVPTVTRVELHDHGGGTRLTLTDGPYTASMRPNAEAGWTGSFEKLERALVRSA